MTMREEFVGWMASRGAVGRSEYAAKLWDEGGLIALAYQAAYRAGAEAMQEKCIYTASVWSTVPTACDAIRALTIEELAGGQ